MRILYGITKSNFGGAQRYVFELVLAAKERGHEVAVLVGGRGLLIDKLKGSGVRAISLPYVGRNVRLFEEVKSFFDILRILREERPDVFHINSSKMGGLGTLAARVAGVKRIIFTGHGWTFNEPRPWWQRALIKFFVWLTILLAHKTICVSEQTRQNVAGWPFIKNKLVVIYNGIREFDLAVREDKTFTVGTIAELHKIKGLDILLDAWGKFIRGREARLIIMGEGEERTNLEKMAKNNGISVEFKGFVRNGRSLLSGFDIFVLPSRSEALPYALLEAGLAALPVVATAVGGIPEIIESGLSGVLIPKEDPKALHSALILLYEDPKLRERLGQSLKEVVKEKFSFERMIRATLVLY